MTIPYRDMWTSLPIDGPAFSTNATAGPDQPIWGLGIEAVKDWTTYRDCRHATAARFRGMDLQDVVAEVTRRFDSRSSAGRQWNDPHEHGDVADEEYSP